MQVASGIQDTGLADMAWDISYYITSKMPPDICVQVPDLLPKTFSVDPVYSGITPGLLHVWPQFPFPPPLCQFMFSLDLTLVLQNKSPKEVLSSKINFTDSDNLKRKCCGYYNRLSKTCKNATVVFNYEAQDYTLKISP